MKEAAHVGLQARLLAAFLEVAHLDAIVTHPWTRTELASIESMLRRCNTSTDAPEHIESILEAARLRLRVIHDAIAASGADVAVKGDVK